MRRYDGPTVHTTQWWLYLWLRLAAEKERVREEEAWKMESAITAAVAAARDQWLVAQEEAVQVMRLHHDYIIVVVVSVTLSRQRHRRRGKSVLVPRQSLC